MLWIQTPRMLHTDSMNVKTRKAEQSEATRAALLKAARELFTERGYSGTSTEEVVRRARVTRGALYHHFRDKSDLFAAVFEDLSREVLAKIKKGADEGGPIGTWEHLVDGCLAWLDACLDPAVTRIVFLDAPSALGWERWRELDGKYGGEIIWMALEVAMDAGLIERQPLRPLVHMVAGALNEAAMGMIRSDDPQAARVETGAAVVRLLEGLRART